MTLLRRLQSLVFRPGELGLVHGRPTYWERLVYNRAERKLREREQAMRGERA